MMYYVRYYLVFICDYWYRVLKQLVEIKVQCLGIEN